MQTTESLKRRMKSAGDLLSVVKDDEGSGGGEYPTISAGCESLTDYKPGRWRWVCRSFSRNGWGGSDTDEDRYGETSRRHCLRFRSGDWCGQLNDQIVSVFYSGSYERKGIKEG